jgi:curli biogenesis system outer membrane secretion channel CsgG
MTMGTHLRLFSTLSYLAVLGTCAAALAGATAAAAAATPTDAATAAATTPDAKQPVTVAIYEFRSSVQEIPARGATDMFITSLVHNGRFNVVERSQLNQSLLPEKQLNSQGLSTGTTASQQLHGVQYLFEGTISEVTASEDQRAGSVGIAGVSLGGGTNKDEIAVDVRVVEAATGRIVDAVTVRKALKSKNASVSAVGLLNRVMSTSGFGSPYSSDAPNVSLSRQRKDSLDEALRAIINDAVSQLATKL